MTAMSNGGAKYVIPTKPLELILQRSTRGMLSQLTWPPSSLSCEWIAHLKGTTMGFNHRQPLKLSDLDHMDVLELTKGLLKEWDGIETPASFFVWR
jgi:hypothetical protein